MATRQFETSDWEHDWQTENQHTKAQQPRWLTCTANEFIYKWLPKFESGELEYKETRNKGQGASVGGD